MRGGRGLRALFVGVVLGMLVLLLAGCGFGGAEQITLGHMPWDENAADSNLVRVLLEDELGPDDPQTLHTVAREGFSEDDPVAHALINAMRHDEEQMGLLEVAINDATDAEMESERGARDWLDDPANREAVRPWIQAARRTEEG